jgi:DNA gyrase inhibitor GyrI
MPEIKEFPAIHVAYVAEKGAPDLVIQQGFERLFNWLRERGVNPTGSSMAIFYDDPTKVRPDDQRVDTCAPVAPAIEGSDVVRIKTIGGSQVATIVYQGRQNREQAYADVYQWLKAEGYHDSGAPIETYLSQLGQELRAEIAVPVERVAKGTNQPTAVKREQVATTHKSTRKGKPQAQV